MSPNQMSSSIGPAPPQPSDNSPAAGYHPTVNRFKGKLNGIYDDLVEESGKVSKWKCKGKSVGGHVIIL